MSDPSEDDPLLKGPSLSADGHLEGRLKAVEAPPPAAPAPKHEDSPLELAERAPKKVEPRVESFREEPKAQRRPAALKIVIALLALAVIGFVALLRFQPRLRTELPDGVRESTLLDELTRSDAPPLIITSEPPGAVITIDGKTVGQTPWAGENRWSGTPKVVLQLNGYAKWEGKLNGGSEQTIAAELKR